MRSQFGAHAVELYRRLGSLALVSWEVGLTVEGVRRRLIDELGEAGYSELVKQVGERRKADAPMRFRLSRDELIGDLRAHGSLARAAASRGVNRHAYREALRAVGIDAEEWMELSRRFRREAVIREFSEASVVHGALNTTELRRLGLRTLWGRIERLFGTFGAFTKAISPAGHGDCVPLGPVPSAPRCQDQDG